LIKIFKAIVSKAVASFKDDLYFKILIMIPDKKEIFCFLKDLLQNNSKAWMDDNRHRYTQAKAIWLTEIEKILDFLRNDDSAYFGRFEAKDCISRITNNRMYKPDLPPYKDYFTFSVMDKSDIFSPIHISVGAENSFVGCGYHNPDKETLKNIRGAIDYEGEVLQEILEEKDFKAFFGGLSDYNEKLKTSPKGYAKDHPFVEYLRFKNFTIMRSLTETEVISDEFIEIVKKAYILSKPFQAFLKKANSF
jgi:uncharacterized protein (TIGR02453 family)